MISIVEQKLLDLLACPRCGGELGPGEHSLTCFSCGSSYEVRSGIPVLMPEGIDFERLAEEERLGEIMTDKPASEKDTLSEQQWALSKIEYWDLVRERLGTGKTIVNIGCGFDREFLELAADNVIVAFDLICPLLEKLRDDHGSALNVAGAVQALPFRDEAFDAICCIDLIHHEPDRLSAIFDSFARILRPGGMLFLEDINAWGLLQFWKSKMMSRPLHGALRDGWHIIRESEHRPAPYEFPTDVFKSMRMLRETGLTDIEALELKSYPNTGKAGLALYGKMSAAERVRRYHNFHYMIFARKA